MQFAANTKLLMIGDSITDCGRARPVGEVPYGGLGNGYVSLVDGALRAVYPEMPIRVVNQGISGNTVIDLASRWQQDVLDQKPDYVTVMIGVNDVWRQFDSPNIKESHVSVEVYGRVLEELVSQTFPHVKQMYLLSPFYLEPNREDPMRSMVDTYGLRMKCIAEEANVPFIDVQAAFDGVLQHLNTASLAGDRVHPNVSGHTVIANAFLKAIDFDWAR